MATFRVGRSRVRGGDRLRSGSVGGSQVSGSGAATLTLGASAEGGLRLPGAGTATLVLDAMGAGSLRLPATGTAALVLTAAATASNYANGAAAVGETTEAATLTLAAFATGSVVTPVVAPPAGSTVAPIKRVSITMPPPVLDAQGRPI